MTIEEISSLVAQRLLQGFMNHEQFSNYYHFLGLDGYKTFHKYHCLEETLRYKNFMNFYISQYDKLIPKFTTENLLTIKIIPDNWYGYTRLDVDIMTRKNAVKSGLEKYVQWEKDTKHFLQNMIKDCEVLNEYGFSEKLKEYLKETEEEIDLAQKEHLEIRASDYDLSVIVDRQRKLNEKYIKKVVKIDNILHDQPFKGEQDND